jgi:hypothetical protein
MIESGFCQCGCGSKTNIATQDDKRRGHIKGVPFRFLPLHHFKVMDRRKEKNPYWSGDKILYRGLHLWISLNFGTPSICEDCHIPNKKKYEWANISGLYKRERSDWKRLCTSCHRKFDNQLKRRRIYVNRYSDNPKSENAE